MWHLYALTWRHLVLPQPALSSSVHFAFDHLLCISHWCWPSTMPGDPGSPLPDLRSVVESVWSQWSHLGNGHSDTCLPTSWRHCGKQPGGLAGKYVINHHALYQWFSKCGSGTRNVAIAWEQGRRAGSQASPNPQGWSPAVCCNEASRSRPGARMRTTT